MFKNYMLLLTAAMVFTVSAPAEKWNSAFAASICNPMDKAFEYGIFCENMSFIQKSVQPGDSLEKIFLEEGIPYSTISDIIKKSRSVFDARRMRIGDSFTVFTPRLLKETPRYLVYDCSRTDYVVFDLGKPVKVYKKEKPVEIRIRTAEASIGSSLWSAFNNKNISSRVLCQLSEIYAWTLDFHHLKKNDSFNILFEEKWIHNKRVGTGRVLAACMTHSGRDYFAFLFKQKKDYPGIYYDDRGFGLKKSFLKAPLKYTAITSGYSKKRLHPILKQYRPHPGIDFAAPSGTQVVSVGDGIVEKTKYQRAAGNYVQIRHSDTYMTQYMHLRSFASGLKPGQEVRQGEVIGYVGKTGRATGPHLDFRFWVNGEAVNYLDKDIPKTEPIKKKHMDRFKALVADMKSELNISEIRKFSAEAEHAFAR